MTLSLFGLDSGDFQTFSLASAPSQVDCIPTQVATGSLDNLGTDPGSANARIAQAAKGLNWLKFFQCSIYR